MAKITRATQKHFGSTGPTGDFGQFGSLAAGSAAFTKDPATIQSLAAWLTGWAAETIANNRPSLEDQNAVDFLTFYQICYLLQQGIAEWDAGTTYYANSYCQVSGQVYKSLLDDNLNKNPATEITYWDPIYFEGAGVIKMYGGTAAPTGALLCDGTAYSRATYARLFAVVGTKFGSGNGSTTFNVPDFRQRFPLGKAASGTGANLGDSGGTIDHIHSGSSLSAPDHTHPVSGSTGDINSVQQDAGASNTPPLSNDDQHRHSVSITSGGPSATVITGNTGAANPPFLAVNFIITI